jgi:hypothetical protein
MVLQYSTVLCPYADPQIGNVVPIRRSRGVATRTIMVTLPAAPASIGRGTVLSRLNKPRQTGSRQLHWSGALGGLCMRYPPGSNCQEPSRVDGSVHRADSGFQFQGCRWGSTHGMPRNPGEPYHHPMMVPPVPENAVLCQAGAGNLTGFVRRRLLSAEAAVCFARNSHRYCNQTRPMRNAICSLFHLLATVSAP